MTNWTFKLWVVAVLVLLSRAKIRGLVLGAIAIPPISIVAFAYHLMWNVLLTPKNLSLVIR